VDRRLSQSLVTGVLIATVVLVVLILTQSDGFRKRSVFDPASIPGPDGRPISLEVSPHLLLGNPSRATDDGADANNYLMRKPYYALSYNNVNGSPNWVSWRLQASDLGEAPRPQFYPDTTLPRGFKEITPHDYNGSGFDRGHMCPHGDRDATTESSFATFAMTNIIPQAPNVNQKAWDDFEEYCREVVRKRHEVLYIISGPQGRGGEGTHGFAETIANGKITVPAKCWKVAVVVEGGEGGPDDLEKIAAHTRVIAIVMPNTESVGHGWANYRTNVREIESLTGFRFFDRVPADIAESLKAKVDTDHVPPSRPHRARN
jgi:endonuclease G